MVDARFYDVHGPFSLENVADYLGQDVFLPEGCKRDYLIEEIAELDSASSKSITVFSNPSYKTQFLQTKAAACLVSDKMQDELGNTLLLKSSNPYYAYCRLINLFYSSKLSLRTLAYKDGCYISGSAHIGANCHFGYNVVIEDDVEIGDNCFIDSGVVVKRGVKIGNDAHIGAGVYVNCAIVGDGVHILAGARIGSDGYGFATHQGVHHKIFHVGRVIIGDNVEIGANTTIDRGSIRDTIIGDGCKIDNLVQIGHNVVLGKGCLIVAQVGIAGSTKVGSYCAIGGQAGIAGHLNVANYVQVAAQSGIIQSVEQDKAKVGGTPALPIKDWHRQSILLKKLIMKHD